MADDVNYADHGIPMLPTNLDKPFATAADAAFNVPNFIYMNGGHSRSRGMACIECIWVDFNVLSPEAVPFTLEGRGLNPRYAALEIASLLGGTPVDAHQRLTAKGFAAYQDYAIQRGNYGVRIRTQLRDFVTKLMDDPGTRQAVMTIFDGNRDLHDESGDIPCTLAVQGFMRDDLFYMRTTMRSNDAYLGLPYDLMQFCALQATIAQCMDTPCGFYRHSVGSMHLYAADLEKLHGIEPPGYQDTFGDELWSIPSKLDDPRDRLKHVIMFCQDALYGQTQQPNTEFEHWLVESL